MKIIVMLIWFGAHGGPATIQGFDSLTSCEAAVPTVKENYQSMFYLGNHFSYKCVMLDK